MSHPSNGPLPPQTNGVSTPSASHTLPPYGRQGEGQPEIRPLINNPAPSPSASQFGGPRTPFEHHPNPAAPSIASGAPPPTSAQTAADAAARDREERPGSAAPKRHREWEDDPNPGAAKKPMGEENRSRLDEIKMHRPSPPSKMGTPPHRSPSELRRMEEPRPTSAYNPSEAAHHPPSLPSMQSITQRSPRTSAPPQEEHRAPPPPQPAPPQVFEPAARKMDVDENYDDSGDEEKRSTTKQESRKNSPKPANGTAAAATTNGSGEQQS